MAVCTGAGQCDADGIELNGTGGASSDGIMCLTSADCPSNQPSCAPFAPGSPQPPDAGWTVLICQ